jgi:hypothetical protein
MSTKYVQMKALGLKLAPSQLAIDFPYMCIAKTNKNLFSIYIIGFSLDVWYGTLPGGPFKKIQIIDVGSKLLRPGGIEIYLICI